MVRSSYNDNGSQHIVGLEWRRDEWLQKDAIKLLASILTT